MLYCIFTLLSFQDVTHMYYLALWQCAVGLILTLSWKVLLSPALLFSTSTSPKKHFFSPPHLWLSLPLTVFKLQDAVLCHRDHARNLLAPESHRLTRKTWLTDLVPFPISSGSRVKLTFPAFRLYLNSEPQRLMAPREILLSPLSICLT